MNTLLTSLFLGDVITEVFLSESSERSIPPKAFIKPTPLYHHYGFKLAQFSLSITTSAVTHGATPQHRSSHSRWSSTPCWVDSPRVGGTAVRMTSAAGTGQGMTSHAHSLQTLPLHFPGWKFGWLRLWLQLLESPQASCLFWSTIASTPTYISMLNDIYRNRSTSLS